MMSFLCCYHLNIFIKATLVFSFVLFNMGVNNSFAFEDKLIEGFASKGRLGQVIKKTRKCSPKR